MRVMGLSVLLMGLGLMTTGCADSIGGLIIGTMVMSIGFHWFYPSNTSVVLMGRQGGNSQGAWESLRGVAAFAAVAGTFVVWLLVDGVSFGR